MLQVSCPDLSDKHRFRSWRRAWHTFQGLECILDEGYKFVKGTWDPNFFNYLFFPFCFRYLFFTNMFSIFNFHYVALKIESRPNKREPMRTQGNEKYATLLLHFQHSSLYVKNAYVYQIMEQKGKKWMCYQHFFSHPVSIIYGCSALTDSPMLDTNHSHKFSASLQHVK